ncbi:MAG: chloride channel protein [Tildeniella nuda ZEHNDER 1965/U140]|jgi:CIC family chloride channel protein|nr:chloride channel protein [Tildeniella nuda ZEHNDER 1965/U140]
MPFPITFKSIALLLTPKRLAILEAILIGLVAALAAVLLKQSIHWLGGWRLKEALALPTWLLIPTVGLVGGLLVGLLVERAAPEASGSGVPQVKAALAYVPIALNLRVAVVKLVSTTLALGSGFALGREGPTIQIGAALAAQLSRWLPASPEHQRQLIAAGAAAGLAASFDAPIAGVMFVIEELLQDFSNLTLGTAILASFIGGVTSRVLAGPNLHLGVNPLSYQTSFSLAEIPFFLVLGLLAGVLSTLFNHGILYSIRWCRQTLRVSLMWRIGLAGLVSGTAIALLPVPFRDSYALEVFLTSSQTDWRMVAFAFVVQFGLTMIACGVEVPGGLFVPSMILGASLGHLVGMAEQVFLGGEPVIYALTGMGAFLGASARVPITAIVIVFEITTNFSLVLPLMISSVTAYLVAERLFPGSIYTHLLDLKGIRIEPAVVQDGLWARLTAADVMQQKVETLSSQMMLDDVMQAFARSHHRGFPVVDDSRLVGIVTLTDLDKVAQRQLPGTASLKDIMTPQPITVSPPDTLSHVLYLLSRYKLSRLPVTDHRKLVGIITRSDILQVESDQLRGGSDHLGPRVEPSYVVYQTRAPATGRGRLLLPLSNPQTANRMLKLAFAIAQERQYEVECLQVIPVPRHASPAEVTVNTTLSRRLLRQAVRQGNAKRILVHTQIRAAQSTDQAILDTISDRHIDLLLMGWKGSTSTPGRIFGDVVDTMIRQASCDVVLVKLGETAGRLSPIVAAAPSDHGQHVMGWNRWLLPIAGGPNSQHALKLLPALVTLSQNPEIRLCQVFHPSDDAQSQLLLEEDASFLRQRLQTSVITLPVCANSVSDAVIDMAQNDQCDVIVVGASREGLLQQAIQGNIPETITRHCDCTVILVRKAIVSGS